MKNISPFQQRLYLDNYAIEFVCNIDREYGLSDTKSVEYIAAKIAELFAKLLDAREEHKKFLCASHDDVKKGNNEQPIQ